MENNNLNLSHSTRIIGFGHVSAKILGYMEGVDADKVVFFFENFIEEGYSLEEHDVFIEITLYVEGSSPRRPETLAKHYVRLIDECNLFSPVIEGADRVVFFTALPSLGGFVLAELTKDMADNPLFNHITVSAFSQLPFKFEGKMQNDKANNLYQIIKENVPNTHVVDLDSVIKKDGYLQMPVEEVFKQGEMEIANMIKEYVEET